MIVVTFIYFFLILIDEVIWLKLAKGENKMRCPKCGREVSDKNGWSYFVNEASLNVRQKVMYKCHCGLVLIADSNDLTDLPDGMWFEKISEAPKKGEAKMKCELCDYDEALILIDKDSIFTLCPNHLLKLVTRTLEPQEAKKLIQKHGNETFYLHEDFYDENGEVMQ